MLPVWFQYRMAQRDQFPYQLFQYYTRRHYGRYRIIINSANPKDAVKYIAALPGAAWDDRLNAWHVADNKTFRALFHLKHEYITPAILKLVNKINHPALEEYVQFLELKAYSHY